MLSLNARFALVKVRHSHKNLASDYVTRVLNGLRV